MQNPVRIFTALALLLFHATIFAGEKVLPPLPKSGYIHNRISTQQDVAQGNAVFATPPEQDGRRKLLKIPIPQYATYLADGTNSLVFVIQAEEIDGRPMIGARYPNGAEAAGLLSEFMLLGVTPHLK